MFHGDELAVRLVWQVLEEHAHVAARGKGSLTFQRLRRPEVDLVGFKGQPTTTMIHTRSVETSANIPPTSHLHWKQTKM